MCVCQNADSECSAVGSVYICSEAHSADRLSVCVCVCVHAADSVRVCLKNLALNFDITDPPDSLKHSAGSERGGEQKKY